MAGIKGIVFAFIRAAKAGKSVLLPQSVKAFIPPRNKLMSIALVADVENNAVFWGIKNLVQCNSQLNRTEI